MKQTRENWIMLLKALHDISNLWWLIRRHNGTVTLRHQGFSYPSCFTATQLFEVKKTSRSMAVQIITAQFEIDVFHHEGVSLVGFNPPGYSYATGGAQSISTRLGPFLKEIENETQGTS